MNHEIISSEIIDSILNLKTLLASSSRSGNISGKSGTVKLFMVLKSLGAGYKPEYSVSGEIDGEEFDYHFADDGSQFCPYPIDSAVDTFNLQVRKIS